MAENYFASTLEAPRLGRRLALCVGIAFGLAAAMRSDGGGNIVTNSVAGMAVTAGILIGAALLLDLFRIGQGVRGRGTEGSASRGAPGHAPPTYQPIGWLHDGAAATADKGPAPVVSATELLPARYPVDGDPRPVVAMPPAVPVVGQRATAGQLGGDPQDLLHALAEDPLPLGTSDPARLTSSPRGMLPTPEEVRDAVTLLFGRPYAEVYALAQDPLAGSSVHDLHAMAEEWVWRQKEAEHSGTAAPARPTALPRFGEAFDHASLIPRYRAGS